MYAGGSGSATANDVELPRVDVVFFHSGPSEMQGTLEELHAQASFGMECCLLRNVYSKEWGV